jgi:putative component of membrane protein insertase Oxa1/YidC/SpoIIIJ protein YidD
MIRSRTLQYLQFFLHGIDRLCAYTVIVLIYLLRPMLGPMNMCPMVKSGIKELGCTQYAIEQLEHQRVHHACVNIIKRLMACHPLRKF